jgi:hypothetical protein
MHAQIKSLNNGCSVNKRVPTKPNKSLMDLVANKLAEWIFYDYAINHHSVLHVL